MRYLENNVVTNFPALMAEVIQSNMSNGEKYDAWSELISHTLDNNCFKIEFNESINSYEVHLRSQIVENGVKTNGLLDLLLPSRAYGLWRAILHDSVVDPYIYRSFQSRFSVVEGRFESYSKNDGIGRRSKLRYDKMFIYPVEINQSDIEVHIDRGSIASGSYLKPALSDSSRAELSSYSSNISRQLGSGVTIALEYDTSNGVQFFSSYLNKLRHDFKESSQQSFWRYYQSDGVSEILLDPGRCYIKANPSYDHAWYTTFLHV